MATALANGQRWVTIKKSGPLHGRKLLIDGSGNIVGGKIPKAMHGQHIGNLSGIKHDDPKSHYDSYSHDELKEIHKEFKGHHESMKKGLHDDLHGQAKSMRDQEADASDEVDLIKKIRAKGGVNVEDHHQAATEFKESVHRGVRKAIQKKDGGMGLDQMADELGMDRNELMGKLSKIEPNKYTKVEDYHDKAKKSMPDYEDRKKAIDDLGKHVSAIESAKNRKQFEEEKAKVKASKTAPEQPKETGDVGGEEDKPKTVDKATEKRKAKLKEMSYSKLVSASFKAIPSSQIQLEIRAEMKERQARGDVPPMYKYKEEPKEDGSDVGSEAYDKLKKNYPEDTLGWAKDAEWSKQDGVNLKDIDMARRPGGRDMGKVNSIAEDVKAGKKMGRVHLVKTPGGGKMKIADGYHRTLGHLKGGAGKVDAYVGNVKDENGPWDKEMHDKKLNLSDAEKAKKADDKSTGPATTADDGKQQQPGATAQDDKSTATAPTADDSKSPTANDGVKRRGDRLDELHDDVKGYMDGKSDANDILKKHDRLIKAMARKVAENRGGEAEDLSQEGRTAAYKTLEALKNGTQKPKEGQHLGEHLLRRVKQGLSEGSRQSNERPMSRESSKLAALVGAHKTAHTNETGQEPTDDELFDRVSKDDGFNKAKFSAPGTKKSIEDPREKFEAVRDAMKNQKSQTTLDEGKTDEEGGNMGTKGSNIADPKGSPEDIALRKEAEKEMADRRGQVHDTLEQFGLSPGERHAVVHRFGVGHADATGAVLPWDKVAEHMSKDMKKQVNPETAKKHFNNGRSKLHKHIGDDRMGLLMQKSLLEDTGVHLLIKSLYELGLYDILKKHGLENEEALESFGVRTANAPSFAALVKSLAVPEYIGDYQQWADGSVTAAIIEYKLRG